MPGLHAAAAPAAPVPSAAVQSSNAQIVRRNGTQPSSSCSMATASYFPPLSHARALSGSQARSTREGARSGFADSAIFDREAFAGLNGGARRRFSGKQPAQGPVEVRAQAAATTSGPPAPKGKIFGIDRVTLKKVVPLGLMFFCILFNYTILRDTKDVLVVTAPGSSAEIIPFLKTWVNLPMAVAFMVVYAKLSNVLSKEALFYSCILPFIGFFGAFAFVLYPLQHVLHPTALADSLLQAWGARFMGPLAILRIWSFCLFYVMAELWGSVVVSVLFWGFANQVIILSS